MLRLKRLCALTLVFVSFLSTLSLTALAEDLYLNRARSYALQLADMAQSDAYTALFTTSEDITALIHSWGEGDYSAPRAAYRCTVDPSIFETLYALAGTSLSSVPDSLEGQLRKRLTAAIPSTLNGQCGATALAAASVLTLQTAFASEEPASYTIYFLFFENGAPIVCAFYPEETGVIGASACFLANDTLSAISTLDEMNSWFQQSGVPIGFEEIPVEE